MRETVATFQVTIRVAGAPRCETVSSGTTTADRREVDAAMDLFTLLFGKQANCICDDPHGHRAGKCPQGCLCHKCVCTCDALCNGGDITKRYGGCRCGCWHHSQKVSI